MFYKMIFTVLLVSLSIGHSYAGAYSDPHFVGNRTVIVHLMEWKFEEIAKECELFLGPYGYGGVQVSPVHENAILELRQWWERYQPVSYKIITRSGNEDDFKNMVDRCNKVGVRIYVDIVLNHMTMAEKGKGTGGDTYDGVSESYPGVPFTSSDFHGHESCGTGDLNIHNFANVTEARDCQMGGLRDLNGGRDWVRQKQSEFLNRLIELGVAGFRSDASHHIWPKDYQNIISRLKALNTKYFPANSKPLFYHEIIDYSANEADAREYLSMGRVIEFKNYDFLGHVFRKQSNQRLAYLRNWGGGKDGWGMLDSGDALVMIDSHDLQRGHSGDLKVNIAYFESKLLKLSTAFMLSWPYAITRVMSSYYWDRKIVDNKDVNSYVGPPHDGNFNIIGVKRNADLSCGKEWICEHRWHQIYNMVAFRNIVGNEKVDNWWTNGFHSIAYSRGNKGFIAINNDDKPINEVFKTGLTAGRYCDVISGSISDGCKGGRIITVGSDGSAQVFVDNKWEDSMIAIHIKSKL